MHTETGVELEGETGETARKRISASETSRKLTSAKLLNSPAALYMNNLINKRPKTDLFQAKQA
jgi:hypothetical protein